MRIGVTGIFASGKGTVCEIFEELGAKVIDTDIIAREITEPEGEGISLIKSNFGSDYIDENNYLDRRGFGEFIFADENLTKKLNSLFHPLILDLLLERSKSNNFIYMINTPLLFESKFDKYMDQTIVVTSEVEQVLERGVIRDNISREEIKKRLIYQIPLNQKIKLADYIIDNSGTLENTKRQVLEKWKILMQIAKE
jgi:dephospho-CoA kinase